MAVDNYSDLQKFEHPITFDMVEEDLIAAEEFLSKQLWYSTNYLIDYQLNDSNRGCLLSDGSMSELLKKSESYARNKKFVSEVYVNPFETPNAAISTWYCNNMAFALYNALILLYETPFISFEEFGTLILNYKENVENDVDHEGQILSKKMPYYFIDNFLMKYHEKTFTFPFWSTRYNSIYSILNALSTGHPVLVRVHKTIYSSGAAENLLSRVLETSVDGFDFYTKYHRENLEHYIVLVGLQGENVITIDSSVDGFINYCPLKTLLYSLVPGLLHTVFNNDHFRFYYAWNLNLLL